MIKNISIIKEQFQKQRHHTCKSSAMQMMALKYIYMHILNVHFCITIQSSKDRVVDTKTIQSAAC